MTLLAQVGDDSGIDVRQILTILSIALTVVMLMYSLYKGRRRLRLRPIFDVARSIVQIAVAVAVPAITGVTTSTALIIGAVLMGAPVGWLQGQNLELEVDGDKVFAKRNLAGFAVWGAGLIMMQGAGLANRTGLLQLGQTITWFSIGVGVGLVLGRHPKVDELARSMASVGAALVLLASATGLALVAGSERPAQAQDDGDSKVCPAPPDGYTEVEVGFENCRYMNADGLTATLSGSGAGCGDERMEEWTSRGGDPDSDIHIKDNEARNFDDGLTWFQRYLVLGRNGVVAIASRSYDGGIAEDFIDAAMEYSLLFQPMCADSGDGGAAADDGAGDDGAAVDDGAADDGAGDGGGDEAAADDTAADDGAGDDGAVVDDGAADDGSETDTDGDGVAIADDPGSGSDDGPITDDEALASAIAAAVAAALAGVITWAEAATQINQALGAAGREQNADEIIQRVLDEYQRDATLAPPIDPDDPANNIFRHPDTGEITISDGSQGVPPGHVWDPWSGRWLSPEEAADARARAGIPPLDEYGRPMPVSDGLQRFPDGTSVPPGWVQITDENGTRWVSPDEARTHVADRQQELRDQERLDEEWDEETQRGRDESDTRNRELDEDRRRAEEQEARDREEAARQVGEAYEQLERIRQAAARRGWDDILERIDQAFAEDGSIDPEYVDRLAAALSNRIRIDLMGQNPSPSMVAETLRSLDRDYGDVIPDFMIDEIQRQLEETWFGDFTTGTLRDMRDSAALRILSGFATGGVSEVAYQSADLGEAILADIDRAIAEGRDPDDYMVLRNTARVLIENNAPINTARVVLGPGEVSPEEVLMALVGDLGAVLDIGESVGRTGIGRSAMGQAAEDFAGIGDAARRGRDAATDAFTDAIDRAGGRGVREGLGEMAESVAEGKARADHAVDQAMSRVTEPFNRGRQAAQDALTSARQRVDDALGREPVPGSRDVVPDSARGTIEPDGTVRDGGADGPATDPPSAPREPGADVAAGDGVVGRPGESAPPGGRVDDGGRAVDGDGARAAEPSSADDGFAAGEPPHGTAPAAGDDLGDGASAGRGADDGAPPRGVDEAAEGASGQAPDAPASGRTPGDVEPPGPGLDADAPGSGRGDADGPAGAGEGSDDLLAAQRAAKSPTETLPASGAPSPGPDDMGVLSRWEAVGANGRGEIYDRHGNLLGTIDPTGRMTTPDGRPIATVELDSFGNVPVGYRTPDGRYIEFEADGTPREIRNGVFRQPDDVPRPPASARTDLSSRVRTLWDQVGAGRNGELYGPNGQVIGTIDSNGRMMTLDGRQITYYSEPIAGRLSHLRTADGEFHGEIPRVRSTQAAPSPDTNVGDLLNAPPRPREPAVPPETTLGSARSGGDAAAPAGAAGAETGIAPPRETTLGSARSGGDAAAPAGAGRGADDASAGAGGRGADDAVEGGQSRGADDAAEGGRSRDGDAAEPPSRSADDGDLDSAREPRAPEADAVDPSGTSAHPDAGTGSPSDEWLRAQTPGTHIPPERIREVGYTPAQARALREVAERNRVIFGTRVTNIYSTRFIENGTAIAKPVWMKAKTINEWDELIGGPPASLQGQVGVFEPRPPTPPAPREAYQRFNQRQKEWNKLKPEIDRLRAEGLITVEGGVVHKVLDPGPPRVTKPFAGDIDAVVILREDGSPVSGAEYRRIVEELKQSGAMLQHGAEANIVSDMIAIKTAGLEPDSFEFAQAEAKARLAAEELFDSLNQNHLDGKEQVIWTGRNGHTVGGPLEELAGWQERIDGRHTDAPPPKFGRLPRPRDDDDDPG